MENNNINLNLNKIDDNKPHTLLDDISENTIRNNLGLYLLTPLQDINELRNNFQKSTLKNGRKFYNDSNNIRNYTIKYKKTAAITLFLLILFFISFSCANFIFSKSNSNNNYLSSNNTNINEDVLINEDNEDNIDDLYDYIDESSSNHISNNETIYNSNNSSKLSAQSNSYINKIINKYKYTDYIIPTSNDTYLSFSDLNDFTVEELFIARNEIFARHGYTFSTPNLKMYFESKDWFVPNSSYNGNLNKIEIANVDIIKAIEFLKMAYEDNSPVYDSFVFYDSDTRLLTYNEVSNLNDWELLVAKNEIFARYGLNFSTIELRKHFNSKFWYYIDYSVGNDVTLNSIENSNIALLVQEEEKRILSAIDHDL